VTERASRQKTPINIERVTGEEKTKTEERARKIEKSSGNKRAQMAEKDGHNPTFLDGGGISSSFDRAPSFFEGVKCK